ncbi:G5 domain-containing protein [Frigoribacterium sp. VKM Ac-1396]|nr:G5 domain-containing protein [Frigoribacterium sp. VKM Ac-1396]
MAFLLVVGGAANAAALGAFSEAGAADGPEDAAQPFVAVDATKSPTPAPTPTPTPVVDVSRVDESESVPFESVSVEDANRDIGSSAVTTAGQAGTKVRTYEVTSTDGVETGRTLVGEIVTLAPVQQVTSVGTRVPYVAPAPVAAPAPVSAPAPAPATGGCDSNYSGACVPVASDVDCAGGSGNGPAYIQGPVTVVGSDVYDLDRDGDGIACDR